MNKKILLLLGVIFALFVSGCTADGSSQQGSFELNSFKGGNDGLAFSYVDGMPPATTKDGGLVPFNIRILVENMGEFDVPENSVHVALTGFDLEGFNVEEPSKTINKALAGFKKQGNVERPGARDYITFNNLRYMETLVSGSYTAALSANVCYPYGTQAVIAMCIAGNTVVGYDSDFENCDLEGDKDFANSGSPVKIENVKQYSGGSNSVQIQFDIVHDPSSANGRVFKSYSIDSSCKVGGFSPNEPESIALKDIVTYSLETGLSGNVDCDGTGTNTNEIVLADDRYTVSCLIDTSSEGDSYEKLVTVNLNFDYVDRISKSIVVEHIDR